MHWTAGHRRGAVRLLARALETGPKAVLAFVEMNATPQGDCHIWNLTKNKAGYGYICDPRLPINRASPPRVIVSRLVCETLYGPMDGDLEARHLCHNPPCVNPAHIAPGTRSENLMDSVRDGRWTFTKGEGNGRCKLLPEDADVIRRLRAEGYTHARLARQFKVAPSTINRVVRGDHWTAST